MEAKATKVEIDGSEYIEWLAPDDFAAGWHTDSAPLGEIGNTVLNGHHNVHGKVFENLAYLQQGDIIKMYSGEQEFDYIVTNKMVLPERFATLEKRMENARWIMPSDDERLTLVTCWPKQTNTHRLVIVARPAN
jgi:sortase A